MRQTLRIALLAIMGAALLACASKNTTPRMTGTEIGIRYAEVTAIDRVKMPSAAPAGAVVGGFTGLMLSRRSSPGKQLAGGVAGAALGGLATAALEGDRLGYSYRLRYLNGNESDFITEKGYLRVGDCVSVESGRHMNIRRVASAVCDSPANLRVAPVAMHKANAQQCHDAKEQLLLAQGKDEIADAARKVEIICHF